MSNPVQYPVQAPLPPRRRRSFAGPFVLIVVGIVFLLGNLHMLSWMRLGTLFAHYWPALLILGGVIKLIEYQQAQRDGVPTRGLGAGGVFLVIVIVFFGLIATQASRFNWGEIRDNMNIDDSDLNNIFGETYNFNDHLEQDLTPGITGLRVSDDHGAVRVSISNENKITVTIRKRVGAENQSDADKYNTETKPTLTTAGGLTLDANTHAAGGHPVETDLDISMPRKMELHITSRRGDVSVTGRDGAVEVNGQHGDVSVEDVTGNVKLNLEKSSARVEQITGDVHISGRLNQVTVADVKGAVQLEGEFGESVKLSRISKNVNFKSSRTDMEFSRIDGDLDLDSDDLHADRVTGPVHLTTRSKQIRLEDVSGDVRLQNENGGVEVSMRSLGNVQIDNRNGEIHLDVPDNAGFRVDARTRDGEIQSDFAELKIESGNREAKASGSVGNATSHIVLNNEHEGIEIRRAVRASLAPPAPSVPKPGRSLPPPKAKVEPTEN
jgi:putative adhesin